MLMAPCKANDGQYLSTDVIVTVLHYLSLRELSINISNQKSSRLVAMVVDSFDLYPGAVLHSRCFV